MDIEDIWFPIVLVYSIIPIYIITIMLCNKFGKSNKIIKLLLLEIIIPIVGIILIGITASHGASGFFGTEIYGIEAFISYTVLITICTPIFVPVLLFVVYTIAYIEDKKYQKKKKQ